MNYTLVVVAEFDHDIADIEMWYESKNPGVGLQFTRSVRDEVDKLLENPLIHSVRDHNLNVRWVHIPKFPYKILFRVSEFNIFVLGVFHEARHSRHWKKRAKITPDDPDNSYSAT
jgi:plasmid stabilization system protein ParE